MVASLRERLASPVLLTTAIGLWLLAHAILRLAFGPVLGMDDAEQALYAQAWSWGYRPEQPPLFTWLLTALHAVLPPGILPIQILRTGFLGLFFLFMALAARAWIADRALAHLAVLSTTAIYTFGFYVHHDLTHSTVLATACAAMLWLAARITRVPTTLDYVAFGVALGLGALGKWNAVMLGAAVLLTGLVLPALRPRVLDVRIVLSAVIAAVLVLPTALWVIAHQDFAAASRSVLIQEERSGLDAVVQLAKAMLAFPQPFLVLWFLILGGALTRALAVEPMPTTTARLGLLVLIGLGLHAVLIPLYGGVDFSERWMIAVMLPLPIALFAWLEPLPPDDRPLRLWLVMLVLLAAAGLVARAVIQLQGGDSCGKCRTQIPFATLAGELRAAGFTHGTILAEGFHLAGNLRWTFPESRIVEGLGLLEVFGPAREGMCLIAWPGDAGARMPDRLARFARGPLAIDPGVPFREGRVSALIPGSSTRAYEIAYRLYPDGAGNCR